jgi:hypothetical protein
MQTALIAKQHQIQQLLQDVTGVLASAELLLLRVHAGCGWT